MEIGNIFDMNFSAVSKLEIGIENAIKEDRIVSRVAREVVSTFKGCPLIGGCG